MLCARFLVSTAKPLSSEAAHRKPLLQIRGLTLETLEGARLVEDVSLEVASQEFVGVVGESGAGKTLTALAVLGLLPSGIRRVAGDILFDGTNLSTFSAPRWREVRGSRIAMVFQEPGAALDPLVRIEKLFADCLTVHRQTSKRRRRQAARTLLEEVGIDEPDPILAAYPDQISGGQQQRVLIALALAGDPDLLIADEPTSALDAVLRVRLLDLLRDVASRRGLACLLISHDLAAVARLAARTYVMWRGRVVEASATQDLLRNPRHPYTQHLLSALEP